MGQLITSEADSFLAVDGMSTKSLCLLCALRVKRTKEGCKKSLDCSNGRGNDQTLLPSSLNFRGVNGVMFVCWGGHLISLAYPKDTKNLRALISFKKRQAISL